MRYVDSPVSIDCVPAEAARLAERDMQHAKAAMGGEEATGLREQLQKSL